MSLFFILFGILLALVALGLLNHFRPDWFNKVIGAIAVGVAVVLGWLGLGAPGS